MPRNPSCQDCELHKGVKNVCIWGTGPKNAKVMIIGEAPGANEDNAGKPFVGRSGQLLREELHRVGINPDEVYITNTVKCRPPDNKKPKAGPMKACKKYIDEEIATVRPEYVVTLGAIASKGILKKAKITEVHGKLIETPNYKAMAAYHPAYCLYDPSKLPVLRKDLKRFGEILQGISQKKQKFKWRQINDESVPEFWTELGNCEWFSFDLETESLDWFNPEHKIVVLSMSFDKGGGTWILPSPVMPRAPWGWKAFVAFIKRVAEKIRKWRKKGVAHNGKFDNHWLWRKCHVTFSLDFDTMLASHTINENRSHALDSLATEYLDAPFYDIPLSDKQGKIKPDDIPRIMRMYRYAAKDSFYTLQMRPMMQKELEEDKAILRLFERLVMRAARAFHEIEDNGMKVLMDKFAANRVQVVKDRDASLVTLNAMAREAIRKRKGPRQITNWNSPQQVARLLFEDLKLPVIELTDGGAPSTGEATLVALKDKHPVANQLVKYRELDKFLSTYLDGWKSLMHEDRVYFSYKLHGTVTGRYSSRLHQTPRDGTIRNCIDAPEGWTFVQGDFSQAELRVAAIISGDPELIHCFKNGIDVHWRTLLYVVQAGGAGEYVKPVLKTAAKLAGRKLNFNDSIELLLKKGHEAAIKIWDGWKEARKKAKGINFGFVYGMREQKFIEYAKLKYGFEPTEEEAAQIRRAYFQLYRGLEPWHTRMKRLVKLDGFVRSLSGRLRRLPGITSHERSVRSENERQAINSPIQGFIGDFKAMALVELAEELDPERSKVVGEVHDAILFWVRTEHLKEELPKIAAIMQNPKLVKEFKIKLPVPIDVELDYGPWGQRGNIKWVPEKVA
jgi:uracil-DNA glycosylase family 4